MLIVYPFQTDPGLRRASRRHRCWARRPGAEQSSGPPPPQGGRRSIRCARGWKPNWRPSTAAAAAIRPRTTRSAATRMPPPSSRRELDRVTSQAKRMGCDSSGFFSLFNGQSAQCGPVNNQIQQMRANLDQITTNLERLRSGGLGGADRDNQRRSVLTGARAEQLRAAICQRCAAAAAGRPRQFPEQPVRRQQ